MAAKKKTTEKKAAAPKETVAAEVKETKTITEVPLEETTEVKTITEVPEEIEEDKELLVEQGAPEVQSVPSVKRSAGEISALRKSYSYRTLKARGWV